MKFRLSLVAALALMLMIPGAGRATTFRSSYVEFDLPDEWTCELETTAWVCTDDKEGRQKSALIVLAAKVKGPDDRLDSYEDHLAATRPVTDGRGNQLGRSSRVDFVRRDVIGDRTWIRARHYESELAGYFTEYLASTTDTLAILITFSAYEEYFDRSFDRFFPAILSIRLRSPPK